MTNAIGLHGWTVHETRDTETMREYHATCDAQPAACPMPDELLRGGIIGTVEVVGIVAKPRETEIGLPLIWPTNLARAIFFMRA